jgi:HAD superfamily hydrolase (TIGR01509 family)
VLIIFDCDGVLIDSEIIACSAGAEMMTRLGHAMTMHEFASRFTGIPSADTWTLIETEIGRAIPEAVREAELQRTRERFAAELQPIAGAQNMLRRLQSDKCVASSTGLVALRRNLGLVGLLDLFEPGIFSASQVARGKPAPDVFLYAASQMGTDPESCLVLEDSVAGVTAARRAGMRVAGFTGGSHADPALPRRLRTAGAETILSKHEDVLDFLAGEGATIAPAAAA